MKVRRTPWWYYLVALIIGLAGGVGLAMLDERMATSLLGAPWFVDVVLMAMGIAVLALALQVHAYANTDPAKRPHAFINPQRAMITLVLAKALGLAGAALAGWYGGQARSLPWRDNPEPYRVWVAKGDPNNLLPSINETIARVLEDGTMDSFIAEANELSDQALEG